MKKTLVIPAVAALFIISARGQNFTNLDFELAYGLPGNSGFGELVAVTNALPDWTAYHGPADPRNAYSAIYYETNIASAKSSVVLEGGSLALNGQYSVELFDDSGIGQTGSVPVNAESLQFEAEGPGPNGSLGASGLSVTLGADTLSLSVISAGPDYSVYGANIPSGLDGDIEELLFSCQGTGLVKLDNIEFSPESIPEPSGCALLALGAVALLVYRRRC